MFAGINSVFDSDAVMVAGMNSVDDAVMVDINTGNPSSESITSVKVDEDKGVVLINLCWCCHLGYGNRCCR